MPLPMPVLDNRTWTELIAEGRALIPNASRKWTDHNAHDPGITLMELFAWLSEMLIFRLDRVSPAKVRAFLRLVGVTPRPPLVASTVIALRADPASTAGVDRAERIRKDLARQHPFCLSGPVDGSHR